MPYLPRYTATAHLGCWLDVGVAHSTPAVLSSSPWCTAVRDPHLVARLLEISAGDSVVQCLLRTHSKVGVISAVSCPRLGPSHQYVTRLTYPVPDDLHDTASNNPRAWNTTSTPDHLGRLAALGLPDSDQGRPEPTSPSISSSHYSTTDRADIASTMAASPSTLTQDVDTMSLPSLTRDSSHESEASSASSTSSQHVAVPAQPLLFNPFTDERDTASLALQCPFRFRPCVFVTDDAAKLCGHTHQHFKDANIEPPKRIVCIACPKFHPQSWDDFILHMAKVHSGTSEKPSLLGEPKTDLAFLHYLWKKDIIDNAERKELDVNPVGPLTGTPETITARYRERRTTRERGRTEIRARNW